MKLEIDATTASGAVLILGALATLFASLAGAVTTVVTAVKSARDRVEVKAATALAAEKATTAVQQNEEIISKVNGHQTELVALVGQAIEAATKPPIPVVIPADGVTRRVRATDLDATAAAARNGPPKAGVVSSES